MTSLHCEKICRNRTSAQPIKTIHAKPANTTALFLIEVIGRSSAIFIVTLCCSQ